MNKIAKDAIIRIQINPYKILNRFGGRTPNPRQCAKYVSDYRGIVAEIATELGLVDVHVDVGANNGPFEDDEVALTSNLLGLDEPVEYVTLEMIMMDAAQAADPAYGMANRDPWIAGAVKRLRPHIE